ncbi:MAG: hypothetical protein ABS69_00760 [Nitrosomonadales bacterium SCN 54-20]|nr:MAG: hypothetical protein ABS69_00760 [Nitrosomonadales bacterium SCN 54-20]
MIETPFPVDWRQLQTGVCALLREVGLSVETEKRFQTPRGEVAIDVYAVDENSVDSIRYIVECKNWTSHIPQSVVHSFTTVMHETGGNIGFIVSREGFQSGARQYLQNTNIVGLTYLELQQRYLDRWWEKFFMPTVGFAADILLQYVEPMNSRRERLIRELPAHKQEEVRRLQERYAVFGMGMAFHQISRFSNILPNWSNFPAPYDIAKYKTVIAEQHGIEFSFSSNYFRDLAFEIARKLQSITAEFHDVFGKNIFA